MGQRQSVTVTCDASGDATVYSSSINGRLVAIHYVKTDYADTVDFTITSENFGQGIWTQINQTASVSKYPWALQDDLVGAERAAPMTRQILLIHDRVKIVIANAGVTKTGTFVIETE